MLKTERIGPTLAAVAVVRKAMQKKPEAGIKSAYELAMGRLEQKEGRRAPLSAAQKKALSTVDEKTQARIAEAEIVHGARIREARIGGDADKVVELENIMRDVIRKAREEGEAEKTRIREEFA